jgi:hypothetical protein
MNARITLPKDHKAESSEYPRGLHQAPPGTITASHNEFEGNPSKAPTGVGSKICRAYFGWFRSKALRSGSAHTQTATIYPDLRSTLNINYAQ